MHGGDVWLLGFEKDQATLKISGACAHCSLSDLTYNKLIGGLLQEEIPEIKKIIIEK